MEAKRKSRRASGLILLSILFLSYTLTIPIKRLFTCEALKLEQTSDQNEDLKLGLANLASNFSAQTGCDILFAKCDKLANYCQCRDIEQADAQSALIKIKQLTCFPDNFTQLIDDFRTSNSAQMVQLDYLNINTHLTLSSEQTGGSKSRNWLIDHLSIQLMFSQTGQPVSNSDKSQLIERQMIDFSGLINETHLQFLSLSLEDKNGQANGNDESPKQFEEEDIKLAGLLAKFTNLSRIELSLDLRGNNLLLEANLFAQQQTPLKWLNLASNRKVILMDNNNDIDKSPFYWTPNLEYLSFEASNLQTFPLFSLLVSSFKFNAATYYGLPNLISLNLATNKLVSLEEDLFSGWKKDESSLSTACYNANNNGKHDKHLKVFLLPALTQLDLSNNKLKGITFKEGQYLLCTMPNLNQLYLKRNKIIHLNLNSLLSFPFKWPLSIRSNESSLASSSRLFESSIFSRIEYMDLSYNNIVKITAFLQSSTASSKITVKSIDLSHNNLKRPLHPLDSKLIDTVVFEESFNVNGTQRADSRLNFRDLSLDKLESSFELSSNATLCDFLSPSKTTSSELLNELILSNNRLNWISARDFASLQCRDIQTIRLSNNQISSIEVGSFSHLEKLEQLDLSANQLVELNENIFSRNPKLRIIDLSENRIRSLNRNILSHLSDLEELLLNGNELTAIQNDLFAHNFRLIIIDLSQNKLDHLNESLFADLKQLRVLNLNGNQLKRFTHHLFEVASGSTNYAFVLPQNIQKTNLKPSTGSSSKKLANVKLHKSGKKRQNRQVAEGNNVLNLAFNQIDSFQFRNCASFGQNIQLLWLNDNQLKELNGASLKCLTLVQKLHLQSNQIKSIEATTFTSMAQLEYLDISNNQLQQISSATFTFSPMLSYIDLGENNLASLNLISTFASDGDEIRNELAQIDYFNLNENQNLIIETDDLIKFITNYSPKQLKINHIKRIKSSNNDKNITHSLKDRIYLKSLSLNSIRNIDVELFDWLADPHMSLDHLDISESKLPSDKVRSYLQKCTANSLLGLNFGGNDYNSDELILLMNELSNQTELHHLNLSLNQLERWPFNASVTKSLSKLQVLDLSANKLIHFIKDDLTSFAFSQIELLNLSSNSLISIIQLPEHRGKTLKSLMPKIKQLDLSHNRLSWIPAQFFNDLDELSWLRLDHNNLENFQNVVVPHRLSLDFSFNQKHKFIKPLIHSDAGIDKALYLSGLDDGDLIIFEDYSSWRSQIKCQSVKDYVMLQTSSNAHPRYSSPMDGQDDNKVDDERCIDIINMIDSIHLDSSSLNASLNLIRTSRTKLLHLNLRNNHLISIETSDKNRNIVQLDLGENSIQDLPTSLCQHLPELRSINLKNNQLKKFSLSSLSSCHKLVYLDLSFNKLSSWIEQNSTILSESSIVILKLDHNNLSNLNQVNLELLESLRMLDLKSNLIKRDHQLVSYSSLLTILHNFDLRREYAAVDKPILKINEDSLLIDWKNPKTKDENKFSLSIKQTGSGVDNIMIEGTTQLVKFCTLNPINLTHICVRYAKLRWPTDNSCFYLKRPSNIPSCLTHLHEPLDLVTVNQDRNSANKITSFTHENNTELKDEDSVILLIERLKRCWLKLKELNVNSILTSISSVRSDSVWTHIDGNPIYTLTVIKLAIVVGAICIVILLITVFTLLTCLSQTHRDHSSPKSMSESTNATTEIDVSGSSTINKSSASEHLASQTQTSLSSSNQHSFSTGCKSSYRDNLQTVIERKASYNQLDASQLMQQQACSTPSSSIAPSSVETGETLQAIESIQSNMQPSTSARDSVDQYGERLNTDCAHHHQQVATVLRMVKSNSANFESNKKPPNEIQNYSTLNSRCSNYSTLKSKIRALHEHQQQRHQIYPNQIIQQQTEFHQHQMQQNSYIHPQVALQYSTPNMHEDTFASLQHTDSMQQDLDPTTMSLLSINTALSNTFRSSASQQVSPASTTTPGLTDQTPNLCHYHSRLARETYEPLSSGVILEQEEEHYPNNMVFLSNPPPPPPCRAIEALEDPIHYFGQPG